MKQKVQVIKGPELPKGGEKRQGVKREKARSSQPEAVQRPREHSAETRREAGERGASEERESPQPPSWGMRLEELIDRYKSLMNFHVREATDAPAIEQELKEEDAFWRQFNAQLSHAGGTRKVKFMGIRGNAAGKRTGDRVDIPHLHFLPARKFTADYIAPYLPTAESRREYVRQRQENLDPPPYYYDVFAEREGAERWLKSVKRGERARAEKTTSHAVQETAISVEPTKSERQSLGRANLNTRTNAMSSEVIAASEAAELESRLRALTRKMIVAKLSTGEWSIEQAEAEGRIAGIWRLVRRPELSSFDALAAPSWTVPMAIVWIAFRSPDRVVEQMPEWREQVWWYYDLDKDRMMTVDEVDTQRRYPGLRIAISGLEKASHLALFARNADDDEVWKRLKNGWSALCGELQRGTLRAVGLYKGKGRAKKIRAHKWWYLVPGSDDRNRGDYVDPEGKECWSRVTLASAGVLNVWRDASSPDEPVSTKTKAAKRGARAKFDWEKEVYPIFKELIDENGLPDRSLDPDWTRAACIEKVAERYQNAFSGTPRQPPGRSTLFKHLDLIIRALSSNSSNSSN